MPMAILPVMMKPAIRHPASSYSNHNAEELLNGRVANPCHAHANYSKDIENTHFLISTDWLYVDEASTNNVMAALVLRLSLL